MKKKLYKILSPIIVASLLIFIWPKTAEAAIAFDATSNSGVISDNVTPFVISWSHTTTGSNRLLVVGVGHITTETVNSVTYNGTSMTLISTQNTANGDQISLFYLANPTSGANTVLVTMNGSFNLGVGMAVSLTGIDQTTPLDASDTTVTENSNSVTSTVITVADNSWIVDAVAMVGVQTLTVNGQTQRQNVVTGGGITVGMSTKGAITPAGSTSINWNDGGGVGTPDWAHVAASFAPAAATTAVTPSSVLLSSQMKLEGQMIIE